MHHLTHLTYQFVPWPSQQHTHYWQPPYRGHQCVGGTCAPLQAGAPPRAAVLRAVLFVPPQVWRTATAAEGAQGERHARYSSPVTSSSPHARLEPHGSLWLMRGFPRDMFCRRLGVGATRGPGDGSPSAPGASTVVSMGHSVRIDGRTAPGTRSRTPASPPISPPSAMFRPPLPRRYADFVFYTRAPTHPLTH